MPAVVRHQVSQSALRLKAFGATAPYAFYKICALNNEETIFKEAMRMGMLIVIGLVLVIGGIIGYVCAWLLTFS